MGNVSHADLALAILRAIAGLTVGAHGFAKLFRGGRLPGTGAWFEGIGMRPGWLHARMAAYTEVVAGILFAVGLGTSIVAAAIVALMVVAAWTVHRGHGFFIVSGGWEYNLALAAVAVAVSTSGSGRLSFENVFAGRPDVLSGATGLAISALGGTVAAIVHLAVFYRPSRVAQARHAQG